MNDARKKRPAFVIALCALMAAFGTAIMLASSLIPILTYCSPLAAGLLLIPVRIDFGRKSAWMTWAVTALLSLLICADKEAAFFYVFLGYYPIVKHDLDHIRAAWLRFIAKLACFAAALALMYGLLIFVLRLEAVLNDLGAYSTVMNVVLYLALVAVMQVYDHALRAIELLYVKLLRPKLRFL